MYPVNIMPGLNKEQLALMQAQVDMNTKHNLLMRKIYDNLFLLQPEIYVASNPEPVKTPTVIKVQMVWNSKSCNSMLCMRYEKLYIEQSFAISVNISF